jgi:hypothetical protein
MAARPPKLETVTKSRLLNCEFEFECPRNWESLKVLQKEDVFTKRYCDSCKKTVMFVDTQEQLDHAIQNNICVAVTNRHYKSYNKQKRKEYEEDESGKTMGMLVSRDPTK